MQWGAGAGAASPTDSFRVGSTPTVCGTGIPQAVSGSLAIICKLMRSGRSPCRSCLGEGLRRTTLGSPSTHWVGCESDPTGEAEQWETGCVVIFSATTGFGVGKWRAGAEKGETVIESNYILSQ